jgi:hypothetical protein
LTQLLTTVLVLGVATILGNPLHHPTTTDGQAVGAPATGGAAFGDASDYGSMRGRALAQPIVGMAPTTSGRGYWLVARDGGIFSFGDAKFYGSTGNIRLNQPIVGMTATGGGAGYWFVAADGGIFAYGDARFFGSTGARRLPAPIVGMASTATGRGYWLVGRNGTVYAFGDARDYGSATGTITGITATATGRGYWLVAADGRVSAFGDAHALTAAGGATPTPTVAVAATPDGSGYWAASRTGAVRAFGTAPQYGPASAGSAVVGMAPTRSGKGYWLVTAQGDVLTRAATVATSGSYAFLSKTLSGRPMRYNPCSAVRYVINPAGAPAGAVDEVREAFRRLGAATGMTFVDAGTTTETHIKIGTGVRLSYQPTRYGNVWAPILISWVSASAEPVLAGNVLGYGGSTSYWTSLTDQAYVTGEVVFDRDLSLVRPGFGPGLTRGNLVQHEIGHVAGLDHVQDRGQVMYPSISTSSPDGYGPGDRAGLAQLGIQAGCLRTASPV